MVIIYKSVNFYISYPVYGSSLRLLNTMKDIKRLSFTAALLSGKHLKTKIQWIGNWAISIRGLKQHIVVH